MLNTQNRTPFISGHSAKKITFVYVKALTIMKTTRLFIIVFILTVRTAFANLQDDYILLINSYNSHFFWANTLEESFRTALKKHDIDLEVCSEYLNTHRIGNPESWNESMQLILKNYATRPPRLVVLQGDEAWMAYRQAYNGQFGKVKVLLAGVKKYGFDFHDYKNKTELSPENLILTETLRKAYNATGVTEPLYADKTIDLILQLYPGTREIVVVSDNRFYGIYIHMLARKYLREKYPHLKYTPFDGRFLTTDSLYEKLKHLSPSSAILLTSWIQDASENLFPYGTVYEKIYTVTGRPIFAMSNWGKSNDYFVGGYYSIIQNFGEQLANMAQQLLNDVPADSIPLEINGKDVGAHLNQTLMEQEGISPASLSFKNVYYYNRLPDFWEKHKTFFLIAGFVLAGCCLLIWGIHTTLRFTTYRKELDRSKYQIKTSFSNQQDLSDALRIFLQEKTENDSVNKILLKLLKELKADRAYIFEFNPNKKSSSNTYEVLSPYATPMLDTLQDLPNKHIPYLYSKMKDDQLLIIEDLTSMRHSIPDTEYDLLRGQGVRSIFVAPLHVTNQLWGFVGVDYVKERKKCSKQDKLFLKTLAQVLCIGIEHFRSENRTHHTLQRIAELESLFSYASEQACIGVAQWNPLLHKGFATDQWFTNLGESTKDIRSVIDTYQYMHPDDRSELIHFQQLAYKGKTDTFSKPIRIFQNSEWHWYKYHVKLKNYSPSTNQIEVVFLSADIDTLKKVEANLIVAKAKAEESDKLKSAFIANMSHEIRTPLNAIVGFSNILATDDDLPEDEREEYTNIILNNTEILLQLINDILDISKIEAGVFEFNHEKIELTSFLEKIEKAYTLRNSKDIEIKFISDPDNHATLYTDRSRLQQIISNFLNNALKFTQAGHIHFGYKVKPQEIYFYVEDTGIGIPADKQTEIFQRFVKLNSFKQGSGLGLSICSTIVEKLNGKIGVESEPGKGSTFWFSLPYTPTDF